MSNVESSTHITNGSEPASKHITDIIPAHPTAYWHYGVLGLILLLSAFLNFFRLGHNQIGDITTSVSGFYAAAVKSMSLNWHNFFFVAFDPHGFLAIDKPPLGFWLQVLSVRIFGFSQWSLLLPEALAGVGSVAILYILVQRTFGANAGLIAALALALTPISIVTSRNNAIDSILVLTLLFAAWTLSIAVERGSVRWLLGCAVLIGLGFNIKMLEAYLILPAFTLTYLLCAPCSLRRRVLHLVLTGLVMLVISGSWITVVDLVPAGQRPYISSTQQDSELELAIGYNGVNRAFGVGGGSATTTTPDGVTANMTNVLVTFGLISVGLPGPLRLLNAQLGGQIGWLLILALFGLIASWRWKRQDARFEHDQIGLMLWGTWFLTLLIFFSAAFFDHAYYLVTLAPALCALVGIGCASMYQAYISRHGWRSWILPVALAVSALVQGYLLLAYPRLNILPNLFLFVCLVIAIVLLILRMISPRQSMTQRPGVALVRSSIMVCLATLLVAPMLWVAFPIGSGTSTMNPLAGPPPSIQSLDKLTLLAHALIPESAHAQPALEQFLLTHQGQSPYLAATINAPTAAPFILDTGKPVMALGGYSGNDPIFSAQQVATLVHLGTVHYFLLPQVITDQNGTFIMQPAITRWTMAHCTLVPRSVAEPGLSGPQQSVDLGEGLTVITQLFDCTNPH